MLAWPRKSKLRLNPSAPQKQLGSNCILLLYSHPPQANAPTILEHVSAFKRYSSFQIFPFNTALGFPQGLRSLSFGAIALHYSLFGSYPFKLGKKFESYIAGSNAPKLAYFQDEMQYCQERFSLLNRLAINTVFSLLEPKFFSQVYYQNTSVKHVKHTLTGYVSDDLLLMAEKHYVPHTKRKIDVGYRARDLDFHLGRGAREKAEIAERFKSFAVHSGLRTDISTYEQDRIYGDAWWAFVANSKFMLGAMAGASIFDLSGDIKRKTDSYLRSHPQAPFEDVEKAVLSIHEGNINYRTVSPRIFECAAFRTCMILYEDDYQGILKAGRHYIGLKKDFSNIDKVLAQMKDQELVERIVETTFKEIIQSGHWDYKSLINDFDQSLLQMGCAPGISPWEHEELNRIIAKDKHLRSLKGLLKKLLSKNFLGRELLKIILSKLSLGSGAHKNLN